MATKKAPTKKKKPAKKASAKKPVVNKATNKFSIFDNIEHVKVESLIPYRKNPRVGDVDAIAESLDKNGQYRPIVVNRGSRSEYQNEILAGNHTWLGARKLGWDAIAVVFVDVDDDDAARIVLADNKTAELGGYDDEMLASLLTDLGDFAGTGYDDIEVNSIIATLPSNMEISQSVTGEYTRHRIKPDNPEDLKQTEGSLDVEDLDEDEEEPEPVRPGSKNVKEVKPEDTEAESIDAMPDQLPGLIKVVDDNIRFEIGTNDWDIPELIPGMIADLPDSIDCWAGPAICEEDDHPGKTWLYNYSSDSTKGMPHDRTFLSFFVFDDRFENWWHRPGAMTSRALNAGYKRILAPDFSLVRDNPRVEQMYQVYRTYWLSRFFQECNLEVVPKLCVGTTSDDLRWALAGLPFRPNSVYVQFQTIISGKGSTAEGVKKELRLTKEALEEIQPRKLLVYTSESGEQALDIIQPSMPVVIVPSRRRRWQQNKDDWLQKKLADERAKTKGKTK